jgi:hypothetical protein
MYRGYGGTEEHGPVDMDYTRYEIGSILMVVLKGQS